MPDNARHRLGRRLLSFQEKRKSETHGDPILNDHVIVKLATFHFSNRHASKQKSRTDKVRPSER